MKKRFSLLLTSAILTGMLARPAGAVWPSPATLEKEQQETPPAPVAARMDQVVGRLEERERALTHVVGELEKQGQRLKELTDKQTEKQKEPDHGRPVH